MKNSTHFGWNPAFQICLANLIVLLGILLRGSLLAFPPAPNHVFYGMVRDEMGNPLSLQTANVMLESPNGSAVEAVLIPGLGAGVNYSLAVPMDAGSSSDIYRNTALQSNMPFRLRVRIGQTMYLPIEMSGDFRALGDPAKRTRMDLTLGEDSNGNGIPDAWERAQIEGSGGKLGAIDPNEDSDNDGLSNLQEYLAGTIAFDLNDGFSLKMVEVNADGMAMESIESEDAQPEHKGKPLAQK